MYIAKPEVANVIDSNYQPFRIFEQQTTSDPITDEDITIWNSVGICDLNSLNNQLIEIQAKIDAITAYQNGDDVKVQLTKIQERLSTEKDLQESEIKV